MTETISPEKWRQLQASSTRQAKRSGLWVPPHKVEQLQAKVHGKPTAGMSRSSNESEYAYQLRSAGLPEHRQNFKFLGDRKWEFDHAWPDLFLAAEIDGLRREGNGGHQTEDGVTNDCNKLGEAQLLGWTVMRFTRTMIANGRALHITKLMIDRIQKNGQ